MFSNGIATKIESTISLNDEGTEQNFAIHLYWF